MDQLHYLRNSAPTPPLTQQQCSPSQAVTGNIYHL